MQRFLLRYLGEVCRGIAKCFALSHLVAYSLAFGLWKTWFFICFIAYFLQRESTTSYVFTYNEFMPPKHTTCYSLKCLFWHGHWPRKTQIQIFLLSVQNFLCQVLLQQAQLILHSVHLRPWFISGIIICFHCQCNMPAPWLRIPQ